MGVCGFKSAFGLDVNVRNLKCLIELKCDTGRKAGECVMDSQSHLHSVLPNSTQDKAAFQKSELHSLPRSIYTRAFWNILSLELPLFCKCFKFTTKMVCDTKRKRNFPGIDKCFCPHIWQLTECEDERM